MVKQPITLENLKYNNAIKILERYEQVHRPLHHHGSGLLQKALIINPEPSLRRQYGSGLMF